MTEKLFLSTLRVGTYDADTLLTNASGFLFEREQRLYLVTANHVLFDEHTQHRPSRVVIDFHTDTDNLTRIIGFSLPLYRDGRSIWRGARDSGGDIDVAVIQIDRSAMPQNASYQAFTPENLLLSDETVHVGSTLLTIGYPMGFFDQLHHLPVVRQAGLASSYGVRFQGKGYFLVDARTHRGISGAPVVMRTKEATDAFPWKLLGIHASSLESGSRDPKLDEALGLNAVWYADVLMSLTDGKNR